MKTSGNRKNSCRQIFCTKIKQPSSSSKVSRKTIDIFDFNCLDFRSILPQKDSRTIRFWLTDILLSFSYPVKYIFPILTSLFSLIFSPLFLKSSRLTSTMILSSAELLGSDSALGSYTFIFVIASMVLLLKVFNRSFFSSSASFTSFGFSSYFCLGALNLFLNKREFFRSHTFFF